MSSLVIELYRWDFRVELIVSGLSVPGCSGIGIPNNLDIKCKKLTKNPNKIIKKANISLRVTVCFK